MWFELPKSAEKVDAYEDGKPMGNVPSIWLTNIDHGRRHEPLQLMTLKDNLNFSKHQKVKDNGYPEYENYEAIEVPFTKAIPSDYKGTMGVPISFLEKYNPDQFELIKFRHGDDGQDLRLPNGKTPYFRILIRLRGTT